MNRRKKIKQLLEAHAKKANAKLAPKSNKPKYISKADRAKLEAEAAQEDKESEHLRVPKSTFQDQEELITSNDQTPFSQEDLDFLSCLNSELDETVEHCLPIIFSKNSTALRLY